MPETRLADHPTTTHEDHPKDRVATHIILTVPGIRTYGQWQSRFGALLKREGCRAEIRNFDYGVFSLFSYVLPFLRFIEARRFRQALESLARPHPNARIDIVAHSFGTYIVGRSLKSIASKGGIQVHTVI